jgi:hypothetical protein
MVEYLHPDAKAIDRSLMMGTAAAQSISYLCTYSKTEGTNMPSLNPSCMNEGMKLNADTK